MRVDGGRGDEATLELEVDSRPGNSSFLPTHTKNKMPTSNKSGDFRRLLRTFNSAYR